MPQSVHDLPPHLRPVERPPQPELQELPLSPDDRPPMPPPEAEPPRPVDPFLRQT